MADDGNDSSHTPVTDQGICRMTPASGPRHSNPQDTATAPDNDTVNDITTSINTIRNAAIVPERQTHPNQQSQAGSSQNAPSQVTTAPNAASGRDQEHSRKGAGDRRSDGEWPRSNTPQVPLPTARSDDVEPFPELPPMVSTPASQRPPENDYWQPIPQQRPPRLSQSRTGPISIRRLPSHADLRAQEQQHEARSNRFLGIPYQRRRGYTAPSRDELLGETTPSQEAGPSERPDNRRRSTTLPTGDREAALYEAQREVQARDEAAAGKGHRRAALKRRLSGRPRSGTGGSNRSEEDGRKSRISTYSQDYDDSIVDYLDVLGMFHVTPLIGCIPLMRPHRPRSVNTYHLDESTEHAIRS
jgi:hypothetical protein